MGSTKAYKAALKYGYRSGLEERVAKQFSDLGLEAHYEVDKIPYQKPMSTYTPDFKLPCGDYVETKGRFMGADRTKHLLIKKQQPDVTIRFVFTNPKAKLSKTSKTTYAGWCKRHGFIYAKGEIPKAWFYEENENETI